MLLYIISVNKLCFYLSEKLANLTDLKSEESSPILKRLRFEKTQGLVFGFEFCILAFVIISFLKDGLVLQRP